MSFFMREFFLGWGELRSVISLLNLAILISGGTLARAVEDENLSHEIAGAIKNAVVSMCEIK